MACALSVGAQEASKNVDYQLEDPGFEKEWTGNEPYGWQSFASASGLYNTFASSSPQPSDPGEGHESSHSVKLYSKNIWKNANGNLTTGRVNMGDFDPVNSAKNYNYTDIDGGHYLQFKGMPDEVTFWTKFKAGDGNVDKKGRGQFILHKKCKYQDPEIADLLPNRIAIASSLISESDDWVQCKAYFKYDVDDLKDIPTEKYLLASFTTNPNPGQSKNDELYIDDVYFIYYSDLKSLSYDGTPINIEDPENIQIAAKNFDLSKVSCTSGKGADIQTSYDEGTRILTITIEGNDISVNPGNRHEYSVKIVPPASEVTGTYNRWITVNMPTPISESANDIEITDEKDGEVSFGLNEFYLGAGSQNMGPIVVPNAKLSYTGDGSINIVAENQMVVVPGLGTDPILISLTANMSEGKKLTADLNILNGFVTVNVGDIPFTTSEENGILKVTGEIATASGAAYVKGESKANVIDLTGATLAKDLNSSNFSAEANNTLYMIADGQTLAGNNVIQNGTCDNFVLTDGQSFNAPEGFTANQITYKRATAASTDEKDEVYTFVLPFTFTADKVNGTVYELSGVNAGVLDFTSLEGSKELKANRPYLVVSNGTELLNASAFSGEVVATGDLTNEVYGGVTMVGAYEVTPITSGASESWYGYNANGQFVKATSGTINPFRTAIKSTGSQSSFALKLDGTVTGIVNLENPNAKVDVYTVSGVCVRKNVPAASALNGLSRGVYIVDGQKVVK